MTHIYAVYKKPALDIKKQIDNANGKQKKAEVAIIMSDKIDLKIKKITKDKEYST